MMDSATPYWKSDVGFVRACGNNNIEDSYLLCTTDSDNRSSFSVLVSDAIYFFFTFLAKMGQVLWTMLNPVSSTLKMMVAWWNFSFVSLCVPVHKCLPANHRTASFSQLWTWTAYRCLYWYRFCMVSSKIVPGCASWSRRVLSVNECHTFLVTVFVNNFHDVKFNQHKLFVSHCTQPQRQLYDRKSSR